MKKIVGLIVILSLFGLFGCATIFKSGSQKVDTTSAPVKAQVFVNGEYRGDTPLQLKLAVKKEYTVEFRAEGYLPATYHINNRVGAGWVVLEHAGRFGAGDRGRGHRLVVPAGPEAH